MTTYTEYMQKFADGEEENLSPLPYTDYQGLVDAAKAGDETAKKIMSTTAQTTQGWGLIGAGAGAAGGYLISKWLRRKASKKQRALDILIGALIGGGGTYAALKSLKDEKYGLTPDQKASFDEEKDKRGQGKIKSEIPTRSFMVKHKGEVYGAGGGALTGAIGAQLVPVHPFENKALRNMAAVDGSKIKNKAELNAWLNKNPNARKVPGIARARRLDRVTKGGVGGLFAGVLGDIVGYKMDQARDAEFRKEYYGGGIGN